MNPQEIAGGKTAGIPNLLLIGGVALIVYFLFFRNSKAAGGASSTAGDGTVTTGDTTIGTGAVQVKVTQSGSTGASGGGAGADNDEDKDKDDKKKKKPGKRTKKPRRPGEPIRRHPNNENTRGAPDKDDNPQPKPPVHRRRKSMHMLHGGTA